MKDLGFYFEEQLYNEDRKIRFAQQYPKASCRNYLLTLSKCYQSEIFNKKDVCDFIYEELDDMFYTFESTSLSSIQSQISIINKYVEWCIDHGFREKTINPVELFSDFSGRNTEKYVNPTANGEKYVTKDKLMEIVNMCANAQDAVIFALAYSGVKGEASEEIRNLLVKDCDFENNRLKLRRNNGDTRVIEVEEWVMDLIREAIDQEEYLRGNGEFLSESSKSKSSALYQNDFVLRTAGKDVNQPVAEHVTIARLDRIKKWYGNMFLTLNTIWVSGQIEMAKQIKAEKGEVTRKDYEDINERFGHSRKYYYQTQSKVQPYL